MLVKTVLNKQEFNKAIRHYFFRRDIVRRLFLVFVIAVVLATFSFGEPKFLWSLFFIKLFGLIALIYFIRVILPYWIFNNNPNPFASLNEISSKYETFEEGVRITSDIEDDFVTWAFIKNIFLIREFVLIQLKTGKIYIIPSKFFASDKEIAQFLSLIHNKIQKNAFELNEKNGTQLYKYGWFGLIPIYGLFVGLYLAFKGFFKYRNNVLKFIGMGGVLFNFFLFSLVFYHIKYSKEFEDDDYDISGQELNMVVKDIELYKALYSVYPDSLQELLKVDKVPTITDPFLQSTISPFDNTTNIEFHYKKIGENYTLYSVGRDHTANTADDIYPSLLDSNNIKTGLIKRRS